MSVATVSTKAVKAALAEPLRALETLCRSTPHPQANEGPYLVRWGKDKNEGLVQVSFITPEKLEVKVELDCVKLLTDPDYGAGMVRDTATAIDHTMRQRRVTVATPEQTQRILEARP